MLFVNVSIYALFHVCCKREETKANILLCEERETKYPCLHSRRIISPELELIFVELLPIFLFFKVTILPRSLKGTKRVQRKREIKVFSLSLPFHTRV